MDEKPTGESIGHESRFLHYADRTVEVPLNKFETEKPQMPTIAEQLADARARLAAARKGASDAVADSADAASVVLREIEKVTKETAELRAEVASLTNGGPDLEELGK
jgi:predicted  nucleic acid-binding Zn-ribbon protein